MCRSLSLCSCRERMHAREVSKHWRMHTHTYRGARARNSTQQLLAGFELAGGTTRARIHSEALRLRHTPTFSSHSQKVRAWITLSTPKPSPESCIERMGWPGRCGTVDIIRLALMGTSGYLSAGDCFLRRWEELKLNRCDLPETACIVLRSGDAFQLSCVVTLSSCPPRRRSALLSLCQSCQPTAAHRSVKSAAAA